MLLFRTWIKKNTACQALRMCFQSMASRPTASTAPRSLSEMQINVQAPPETRWIRNSRLRPRIQRYNKPSRKCWCLLNFESDNRRWQENKFFFLPLPSWAFPLIEGGKMRGLTMNGLLASHEGSQYGLRVAGWAGCGQFSELTFREAVPCGKAQGPHLEVPHVSPMYSQDWGPLVRQR